MSVLAIAVSVGSRTHQQRRSGLSGCVGAIKAAISDLFPVAAGCVIHLELMHGMTAAALSVGTGCKRPTRRQ